MSKVKLYEGKAMVGRRTDRDDPGDHWVTINGNHVLIHKGLGLGQQAPLPPSPRPPGVDQSAWDSNVDQTHISDSLGTVHDLGLIVFGETQSYSDRPDSNEPIDMARQKVAHTIINADERWGANRQKYASTHGAIEPPEKTLQNPAARAAYDSSMQAAREAYLSGTDPTHGAVHAIQLKDKSRSKYVFHGGNSEGVPISTQSGPYNNSYTGGAMPSRVAWLNTYMEK
jgi:hypothetical protein